MHGLNPTVRSALRLWLAATLAIAITLWTGRQSSLMLALILAVLFVNENQIAPARQMVQLLGGAIVGVITALVLFQFSSGWLMLSLALLAAGLVARALGLSQGQNMAYLCAWAVLVLGQGARFSVGALFNLLVPVLVGVLTAQFATWLVWPRLRRRRLEELDAQVAGRLGAQLRRLRTWLAVGGEPPPALHSAALLPAIQELQQLSSTSAGSVPPAMRRRWGQLGTLWREVLRQWLLLEPQLNALPAPLPPALPPLLLHALDRLEAQLPGSSLAAGPNAAAAAERFTPVDWQHWGAQAGAPALVPLALGWQLAQLNGLLHSQVLARRAIERAAPGAALR
jgi:uncharacterized membrane protein YccC